MGLRDIFSGKKKSEVAPRMASTMSASQNGPFAVMAKGIDHIVKDTEVLRNNAHYDTAFDLYDDMVSYDPELNGAVRTIALTANKYIIVGGKNAKIRNAIDDLIHEKIDFDDFLINAMRNLMVYGNDINKYVGKTGQGLSEIQSLPVSQITITDERQIPFAADKDNPIMRAVNYVFREHKRDTMIFPVDEILHIRTDYRSNWYEDNLGRMTYGVWGASRCESLKQAIRAKYNSMNNRIALEDSLTKQYIQIGPEAVEGISDPDEASERLNFVMDETARLLDGLRSDQVPIIPHYVQPNFVDLKNTVPDNSGFLDQVNGDISAVLHVPRVSMGQERGSTFAATFNASQWSVQAIRRLQDILVQSVTKLFSKHLDLIGMEHTKSDLPKLEFEPIDEESPFENTRRVAMAFQAGITTLNEAREQMSLPPEKGELGKSRHKGRAEMGDLPRENENNRENV